MEPRLLDLTGDPRRAHFDYFRTMANPYLSVTANCDITPLREKTLREGLPFFLPLLYCAANAANDVPELRRRIRGDTAVEYSQCDSSHTVALPDGSYCYCRLNCRQSFARFLPYAQAEVERTKAAPCIDDREDGDSLLFVSSLPWLSFTGLSLPLPQPADSNPRITFGRFFSQDERVLLPVNLTVHHALADGLHVARFFAGLERRAAEFPL